jgi:hypothetical protein
MNIAAILTLITSISKAIPVVDKWIEELVAAYIIQKKIWVMKENRKAIELAIKEQDQRGLEDEDFSGKPSGIGTIRDTLPGVRNGKEG